MLILFFILSFAIVGLNVFLDTGPIIINWYDYHIEISIALVLFALLILIFILFYLSYFIITLKNIPGVLKKYYTQKQSQHDLELLVNGFTAVYRGNLAEANSIIKKITPDHQQIKMLKPLFLLLLLQYHKLEKIEKELEKIFQELLQFYDLKIIALKGLMDLRMEKCLYYEALLYGEKLYKIQPRTDWLIKDLIKIYLEIKQYDNAHKMVKKASSYKFINQKEEDSLLVNCLIGHAKLAISNFDSKRAVIFFEKALKIDPSNYEAVLALTKIYEQKDAHKVIRRAWKINPSIELARLMLNLYDDHNKRIKVVEDLIDSSLEEKASYLSLAELCIDEDMIPAARNVMDKLLEIYAPDSHISKLMAIIEAKAQKSSINIINWLKKYD